MALRALVILKYVGKTPIFASCAQCHQKFFTPSSYTLDPFGAATYLQKKFDRHECPPESRDWRGWAVGPGV